MDKFRNMLAGGATKYWSNVPGLYNKWFPIAEGEESGAGMYIFKTKEQCDAYMKTPLWASMS